MNPDLGAEPYVLTGLRAKLEAESDRQRLILSVAGTPMGGLHSQLALGAARPFPVEGSVAIANTSPPIDIRARVSGALAAIPVQGCAAVGEAHGRWDTILSPFRPALLSTLGLRAPSPAGPSDRTAPVAKPR